MASHLTVTSSAPGSISSRAFASQQASGDAGDALGIFAALLGNTTAAPATTPVGQQELSSILSLGLEATLGDGEGETADPEALAAALEAPTALAVPAQPAPMVNLVDALGQLKASLDAGGTLDPKRLADVEKALADLADALGLELDSLPVPEDFAALLESTAGDTGLAGTLTQLLAPFATSVAEANKATEAGAIAAETAAGNQLKAVGDKLAAILAALEAGDVADEKLAALGMPPGKPANAEIEEALARFTSGLNAVVPEEPVLATPALKLTEPVLSGKTDGATEEPAVAAKTSAASDAAPRTEDRPSQQNAGAPQRERPEAPREPAKAAAFVAPAANAAAPAEQQPAVAQNTGPRIDSASTTRVVVQAGYQTSQQQLNLPQIAFELGRQIEGGNTRFQIRLDPPELGRIDVRMEIDHSGNVNARLTVEKAETLDLMQRDQRGLERALQQAGIDAGKTNLEFSLKQNPFAGDQGMANGQNGRGKGQGANDNGEPDVAAEPTPTVNLYRGSLQASGINITV